MTRFKVYNREYEVDFVFGHDQYGSLNMSRETRFFDREYGDEKWVVESVDGGREMYYASHEEAIGSIYGTEVRSD